MSDAYGRWLSPMPSTIAISHQPSAMIPKSLFAERLGGGGEDLRNAERLGEVAGDADVHRFDRARLGGEAGDDDHGKIGFVALRLANHRQAVHSGHLQI